MTAKKDFSNTLYDILADPVEEDNVAQDHRSKVGRLSKLLLAWRAGLAESPIETETGSLSYPWPEEAGKKKART
jgi:hypothetical protein